MKKNTFIMLFFVVIGIANSRAQTRTLGSFLNDSLAMNGYTLVSNIYSNGAYLIDNCGEIVNAWFNSPYQPGPVMYLLDDGSLLRTGSLKTGEFITGGSGGIIERFDWNDNLIWTYTFDDPLYRSHHDIFPMDNGNILVLSWDKKVLSDCIQAGLDTNHYKGDIWFEKITEIKPKGFDSADVVWEWKLWDHLVQEIDPTKSNFGVVQNNRHKVNLNYANNNGISRDYFHANGIDYNASLDQIIISVRNYDEFWIIDHSTTTAEAATDSGGNAGMGGQILFRWGNQEAYNNGTVSDKKLYGQHHANWIDYGQDSGKIMVFNNGYNAPVLESKVQIINPPLDLGGTYQNAVPGAFDPMSAEWSYTLPVFVDFVSGAYRLENGNTFITSGPDGHLYELDRNDNLVWKYVSPLTLNNSVLSQGASPTSNSIFRAYKYPANYSAFQNKNLVPLGPIEMNPISSNCVIYQNGGIVGMQEEIEAKSAFKIYPNPANKYFEFKVSNPEYLGSNIEFFNMQGKVVKKEWIKTKTQNIDISELNSGLYIIKVHSVKGTEIAKILKQ